MNFLRRIPHLKLIQSFFAEMLCSFFFGYTVYATAINTKIGDDPLTSIAVNLAIAFSSIAIIYTFCDHTVAHFNPAITLAAILTLKIDPFNGLGYIISQIIGFILAGCLINANFPGSWGDVMDLVAPGRASKAVSDVNMFFSEFTLTAIFVFIVFANAVNAKRDPEISLYEDEELPNRTIVAPLTIGLSLGFVSFLAAKTSGSYFNPGLTFAPMLLYNNWHAPWEYFVGQFTGGLLGGLVQVWLLFK